MASADFCFCAIVRGGSHTVQGFVGSSTALRHRVVGVGVAWVKWGSFYDWL